jgi:hypothetical protein
LRILAFLVLTLTRPLADAAPPTDPVYAPLWLYQGTWRITSNTAGAKPDELKNQCALVGKYFACQQTVNGQTGALLIFIPVANNAGRYLTQNVNAQGRATGVGDLEISGDRWVFSSRWEQGGGKVTYYRTTNVFTGKNHIHYEQAESPNGKDWKVANSGDEERVSATGR